MSLPIKSPNPILILKDKTANDVVKAMIEDGSQNEPFYLFDIDEAYRRIQHFKKMMPRVQIFYAMKSNDTDNMIKLVASLGLGFDCASPGEIARILNLNVSPLSIIFAVTTKSPSWIMYAQKSGIRHTTFDTSYELKKIKQYWPNANLLLRIKIDGDSMYKFSEKFGCDFETEAVDLLEEAAALKLKVIGVAFHVGSVCFSADSHVIGLQRARVLFDHEARAGRGMSIVDIGGGFLSNRTDSIDQVSKLLNKALVELFPDPNVQIIAEPGRYICDSAFTSYCNISNIRRVSKDGEAINMIYLNDGIYGSMRYSEPWHTVNIYQRHTELKNEKLEKTMFWGPTCDPRDCAMKDFNIMLPRCTPFDWLEFPSRGAYSISFATNFSSIEKPMLRTVVSQKLWNQIKDKKVFYLEDFSKNPDIADPLPSTLPFIKNSTHDLCTNYTLNL